MPSISEEVSFNFFQQLYEADSTIYLSKVNQPSSVPGTGDKEINNIKKELALMELAFQGWRKTVNAQCVGY